MKHRRATHEELMAYLEKERGGKTTVRHFIMEVSRRNARNGVAHIQRSKLRFDIRADAVYVELHGRREKITASVAYDAEIKPVVYDVRLDNAYLPV